MTLFCSQSDLEEQAIALKAADEQVKKATLDAAHIAEELHREQDHSSQIERLRRSQEAQLKDLQARRDESEASSMKGGKKVIQKLEQRVRELEVELDAEQRRHAESQKAVRRLDRKLKELAFQAEEEHRVQERSQEMVEKLQQKIKTYKRQVEEAVSVPINGDLVKGADLCTYLLITVILIIWSN